MGNIADMIAKHQQKKWHKEQEKKFNERLNKTQVHPAIVRDKEELAKAIYEKEKIIYITGDYYKEINRRYKKVIKKNNLSENDIEELKKAKEEVENEKKRKRQEFSQKSAMHTVIEIIGEVLEFGIMISMLPVVIIMILLGFCDDSVQKELKNYKIKKNKKQERLELVKISGENRFDEEKEYV